MAPNKNRQPARSGKASPKQSKKAPAPQPKRSRVKEESAPGSIMMRMGLLLCTGLVVVGLLFASVNGGSQYVGLPEEDTKATPTPPAATVDPLLNVEGSDITPIPPSASPEGGGTENGGTTEQPIP